MTFVSEHVAEQQLERRFLPWFHMDIRSLNLPSFSANWESK
jgi:hypothetical protein